MAADGNTVTSCFCTFFEEYVRNIENYVKKEAIDKTRTIGESLRMEGDLLIRRAIQLTLIIMRLQGCGTFSSVRSGKWENN